VRPLSPQPSWRAGQQVGCGRRYGQIRVNQVTDHHSHVALIAGILPDAVLVIRDLAEKPDERGCRGDHHINLCRETGVRLRMLDRVELRRGSVIRVTELDIMRGHVAESGRPLPTPKNLPGEVEVGKGAWREMWQSPYRSRTIMLIMFNLLQSVGYYSFASWVPTLLIDQGITVTNPYCTPS
jgi:hypothetical protein